MGEIAGSSPVLTTKVIIMEFDEWVFKVCERIANGIKEIGDIYSTIDLNDAKLAFIDGISWIEYKPYF